MVECVAVTVAQIRQYHLLTRPPKPLDSRTAWYEDMFPDLGCVELHAIAPEDLVAIVRGAIERVGATGACRRRSASGYRRSPPARTGSLDDGLSGPRAHTVRGTFRNRAEIDRIGHAALPARWRSDERILIRISSCLKPVSLCWV